MPLTGNMMVQMSEVSLRNDLKIRDKNDWVKIIQAINQLKSDQTGLETSKMEYGLGNKGKMGGKGGELMIQENEFIEKERKEVYE